MVCLCNKDLISKCIKYQDARQDEGWGWITNTASRSCRSPSSVLLWQTIAKGTHWQTIISAETMPLHTLSHTTTHLWELNISHYIRNGASIIFWVDQLHGNALVQQEPMTYSQTILQEPIHLFSRTEDDCHVGLKSVFINEMIITV